MRQVTLKEVKKGDYFILNENPRLNEDGEVMSEYVYVKDEYDRSNKWYWTHKFDDINAFTAMKGNRKVWIDFMF